MITQKTTIYKTDNLEETQSVNNLLNNTSPVHSKTRRAGGRKKKEAKASELMASYLTTEQKEKVQAYCNKTGLPFSTLVRQLLVEKGIL
jgi:hypothetical protein